MKLKRSGKSPVSPWLPGHFFLLFHLYMILHVQNTAGASMTAFLLRISVHSVQYSGFVFTVWEVWVEYEGSRRKERFYVSELLRYISLLQLLTKLNVAWKRLGHPLEDPTQRHPGVMHTFRGSHWFFSGFPSMGASYFFCETTTEPFISGTNNDTKPHKTFLFRSEDMVCSLVVRKVDTSWHQWGQQCEWHCLRTQHLLERHLKGLSHSNQRLPPPLIWLQDLDHTVTMIVYSVAPIKRM